MLILVLVIVVYKYLSLEFRILCLFGLNLRGCEDCIVVLFFVILIRLIEFERLVKFLFFIKLVIIFYFFVVWGIKKKYMFV